jgi:hypothetical protein
MRSLRALAATVVFVEFGAAAHQLGGGVPVEVIPKVVIAVLVAPLVWLLLRSTVSLPLALLAATAAQVILHLALVAMEPSSGGSAAPVHVHEIFRALPFGGAGPAAGSPWSVPLIQAHVSAALFTCVILYVADDVLRAVQRSHDDAPPGGTGGLDAPGAPEPQDTESRETELPR